MRLLVTGATGLLGTDVVREAGARRHSVVAAGRADFDVTSAAAVASTLRDVRPEVVVHCAAYTSVDLAEDEPEVAMRVNRDGTRCVAAAAQREGASLVYVSSDYVFSGARDRPYRPDDPTGPLSVYGHSKLAGERAAAEACQNTLIARTSWLYGGARRNFVTTMLSRAESGAALTVVDDQIGGPSWSRNVARAIIELVELGTRGVWHVADRGCCSWADLAREAIRLQGLERDVVGVASDAWGAKAHRPRYSVLDVSATQELLGRPLPEWRDALRAFLASETHDSTET